MSYVKIGHIHKKTCVDCSSDYIATGNRSIRCTECRNKKLSQWVSVWKSRNKERSRELERGYAKKPRALALKAARQKEREAKKKKAVPSWFDKEEVKYIYLLAREKQLVVDHIVPLTSKYVCGLHVQENLRCIPNIMNIKKKNCYWPDMWNVSL